MEYVKDLESGSSPKIRKAAKHIYNKQIGGYCDYLLNALRLEMKKSRAWQTQRQLIQAIAISNCQQALPMLNDLIEKEYKATVL